MTEEQAIEHLREMMWAVQRARSIITEQFGDFPNLLEELHPWLFGDKCVLPKLEEVLNQAEAGKGLSSSTFYNFMYIASREPAIDSALFATKQQGLPEPQMGWAIGWQ